jgi:HSP20 family protein
MDELLQRFFQGDAILPASNGSFAPPLDVIDNKDSVIVKAEIPGMKPEEIDISVSGDTLTVRGEKKFEKKEESEGYLRQERTYGSFSRMIMLPFHVKSDKVDATYENGVLEIRLAKSEDSKAQKIKVKAR